MVQRVNVNGVIHQFPDEATPQMIAEALGVQPPDDSTDMPLGSKAEQFGKIVASNRTPFDTIRDALSGALTGLGQGGALVAKTLTGGYAPDFPQDLANKVASPTPSIGGDIVKGAAKYAPYGILGGETAAGQVAAGALSGAADNPNNRISGALQSALINALTGGAANVFEALRPSNVLRGTMSPEQLQQSVDVTKGTQTPLGDVIGSPRLKRTYENVLTHLPFSGASQISQDVAQGIKDQGKNIFSKVGVDQLSSNSGDQLKGALKQALSDARREKNNNYTEVNKLADDTNLVVNRENFSNKAKEILNDIDKSPELKRTFPKDLLGDIQSYADNKEGNSLKLSNIFKGTLGGQANELYTNGKTYEYGIMKELQDALGKDIDTSIENSATPELKHKYQQAQKDYQEKFAPFEDPDVVKFTRKGGDPDLILSHFLRTGQNDRATLLQKLVSKIPQTSKDLPLQMYLAKSVDNGEVNPLTFKSLYDKLGENQKNVLIKDNNTRNMLENYSNLIGKNTTPLSIMANPKTGQQNLDTLTTAMIGLLGHGFAGNVGALAGTVGSIGAGRLGTKALTSEAIRNSLVKKMIENKPLYTGGNKVQSYQAAVQILKDALSGNNNQ